MQISPAMVIAFSAIVRASSSVFFASAFAAASANGPPDPIATMPSSGSMRSPLPDSRNVDCLVEHDEHRLEPAENAIAAPVLGELHGRAFEIAAILFELRLEAPEQRERIGGRAGKAGQNPIVVEPPDLARALLDDGLAERHLAVSREHGMVAVADGEDRRAVNHRVSDCIGPRDPGVKKTGRGLLSADDTQALEP